MRTTFMVRITREGTDGKRRPLASKCSACARPLSVSITTHITIEAPNAAEAMMKLQQAIELLEEDARASNDVLLGEESRAS